MARSSSSIVEMSVISGKAARESSRLNKEGIRLERQRSNFLVLDAGTVARLAECRKLYPSRQELAEECHSIVVQSGHCEDNR